MSRNRLAWAILGWGLLVWGGRLAIVFDVGSDPADRIRIAVSVITSVLASLALWTSRGPRVAVWLYAAVAAFVWIRSAITVATGGGSVAFQAVHALLAMVSLALAALAVVTVEREPAGREARRR